MTISITSTTDSTEAVTAAMGDLAAKKPVEETSKEATAPVESENGEVTEVIEAEKEALEEGQEKEETESEELEAKDESQDDPRPKKKGGFQKRIDKLNKRVLSAEQEREYWRSEALRAQQQKQGDKTETKAGETKTDATKRPKADEFESHDQYVETLTDWKLEQKLAAREQAQRESAIKTEHQTKIQKHQERVNAFAERVEDWDDVIESVGTAQLSITVQEAIINSEQGPELMYELAKDPKELTRICKMPAIQAAMALGKIEARISKSQDSSETTKETTSKAPTPVTPVRTRGAISTKSIYDESLSQRDYEKLRAEQLKTNNMRR